MTLAVMLTRKPEERKLNLNNPSEIALIDKYVNWFWQGTLPPHVTREMVLHRMHWALRLGNYNLQHDAIFHLTMWGIASLEVQARNWSIGK